MHDRQHAAGLAAPHARSRPRLVVIGNGMVGHHLIVRLAELEAAGRYDIVVLGEEHRPAYDRVALSSLFDGRSAQDLCLAEPGFHDQWGIRCEPGDAVVAVERERRVVRTASGAEHPYDHLVLATGSRPFVPPMDGAEGPGRYVYRTIDDVEAISAHAAVDGVSRGAVIGGGLLGLEAARALVGLGLETHVVELSPRLMAVQLDDAGGEALRGHVEKLGVRVLTGRSTTRITGDRSLSLHLDDGSHLDVDLVVFAAGIRPRDDLARAAGLAVADRGGVLVDELLRTTDPAISAVGECAAPAGRAYGLVAPGYRMAQVVAQRLAAKVGLDCPEPEPFEGADLSTKLKLLGVEVANVGDIHSSADTAAVDGRGPTSVVWNDPAAGVHQRVDLDSDGRVIAAVLVGDASPFGAVLAAYRSGDPVEDPGSLLRPPTAVSGAGDELPDASLVCSCANVCAGDLRKALDGGAGTVEELGQVTGAGTGCGGCGPVLSNLVRDSLARRGEVVRAELCSHFERTRAELYEIIRVQGLRSFGEVLRRHGRPGTADAAGAGCEVCRPVVASILASLGHGHPLDDDQAALQDTNDHFLANLQRDGTYSVVPRIPGGEITPDGLIAIGEVARDFGLYTKITGGQRIDMFGARVEQLPEIWRRLIAAGFESGHAYGKALRTVKSCVGSTWCRYGVADSTTMAIFLEERYRGLRAPHKIKMAVSGCARECAEAQSKDVGVIATERGWNLWVGGNGGMRPRHAELLVEDLGDEELVRMIDRFLMYYVRSADRLQRTASWIEGLDGGIEHVRAVVVEDSLGICSTLEEMVRTHVENYRCEWAETLADPIRLARFVTFVNAPDEPDPTVLFVKERNQIRPATAEERQLVGVEGKP